MVAAAPLAAEQLENIQAAIYAVSGERPSYPTCIRWMDRGLLDKSGQRVYLEFVKTGRKRKTSREAVRRFFAKLTASYQIDQLQFGHGATDAGISHDIAEQDLIRQGA